MRALLTTTLLTVSLSLTSCGNWNIGKQGKPYGFSGFATVRHDAKETVLLTVHDNKKGGEPRLGLVTMAEKKPVKYEGLVWPDSVNIPIDGEALCKYPIGENTYVVMSSMGKCFLFTFDPTSKQITITGRFDLPEAHKGSNFEGFDLRLLNDTLMAAIWGHRGQDEDPAVIYSGVFNPRTMKFANIMTLPFKTPFPKKKVRYISDMKMDEAGTLYVVSSSDTGDNGPYESAVYIVGNIRFNGTQASITANSQYVRLFTDTKHKIEAMELVPGEFGGIIYGTDDENKGASIQFVK